MTADLVLKNVLLPTGRSADIVIAGGVVRHVGGAVRADETIDCSGLTCLPAAVDMHVHMRGGVQAEKEDWRTGTESAVAGGVTVVVDQPNTIPPLTTPDLLCARIREAEEHAVCGFAVNAGVTTDADLEGMRNAGAMAFGEIFAAPSSYGEGLDPETLERLLARIHAMGGLATVHAEEVAGPAPATLAEHDRARSGAGEARAVRAVRALAPGGMRLHFCHMSTAASVEAARGTVEATPHHLFLSRDMFAEDDARARVNPPLRDEVTRRGLWSCWERIDIVASDHAPHTLREKELPFEGAPSGMPGVETMVPLLMAAVRRGDIPLASSSRRRRGGLPPYSAYAAPGSSPATGRTSPSTPIRSPASMQGVSTQNAVGRRSKGSMPSSPRRSSSGAGAPTPAANSWRRTRRGTPGKDIYHYR